MEYTAADTDSLLREGDRCRKQLDLLKKQGLSLDLSREKPSPEQLAPSLPILDVLDHRSILDSENGQDCRSYGSLDGIPEARRLLGHMMGTHSARTIISGNSSLSFIYQLISHGMTDGICGGKPWQEVRDRKFLCPVPGCDRHFAITEHSPPTGVIFQSPVQGSFPKSIRYLWPSASESPRAPSPSWDLTTVPKNTAVYVRHTVIP